MCVTLKKWPAVGNIVDYAEKLYAGIGNRESPTCNTQDFYSTKCYHVRFQVLMVASMTFRAVFWVVLPCKIIVDQRFRGAYIPDDGGSTHL
jgi:hypothetical protein